MFIDPRPRRTRIGNGRVNGRVRVLATGRRRTLAFGWSTGDGNVGNVYRALGPRFSWRFLVWRRALFEPRLGPGASEAPTRTAADRHGGTRARQRPGLPPRRNPRY